MNRLVFAAIATALLAGCSSDSESPARFVAEGEGFSIVEPNEWSSHRDQGAVIFVSPENHRRTLAIRSIEASDQKTQRKAVDATKVVLDGLPGVKLAATKRIERPLPGISYELTFAPPGSRERYARTHVVLVGEEHVYHVIETVPANEAKRDGLVQSILASFREEV